MDVRCGCFRRKAKSPNLRATVNNPFLPHRPFMPNLVPPKIPDGERVDFDVSSYLGRAGLGWGSGDTGSLMRERNGETS